MSDSKGGPGGRLEISRRRLLVAMGAAVGGAVLLAPASGQAEDKAVKRNIAGVQGDWRFCHKCQALFFNGYAGKGVCAAGGGHEAAGYYFVLFYDVPGPGQPDWRFCRKCQALFFDGYA